MALGLCRARALALLLLGPLALTVAAEWWAEARLALHCEGRACCDDGMWPEGEGRGVLPFDLWESDLLAQWRLAWGSACVSDALVLGLLLAPRSTTATLLLLESRSGPDSPCPGRLAVCLWACLPQAAAAWWLLGCAPCAFWWALALIHALLSNLVEEAAWLANFARRRTPIAEQLRGAGQSDMAAVFAVAAVVLLHAAPHDLGAVVAKQAVDLAVACHGVFAVMSPVRCLCAGERRLGAAHAAVVLGLALPHLRGEHNWLSLLLMAGPAAAVGSALEHTWARGERGERLLIERNRFVDSSLEQLRALGRRQLAQPPRIAFVSETGPEPGVDLGGPRREWLGRLAGELVDPSRGLVEVSTLGGVEFARPRRGASLEELEALGKVMGLALRDGQPLGVNLCAPLAHLLSHPRLPQAIESIVSLAEDRGSDGRARRRGAEELWSLGFSRDWLCWASPEEHGYWGKRLSEGLGCRHLRAHVASRALRALVLDVAEETKAIWRGLRAVPGVPLPTLQEELRGKKRRRGEAADASEALRMERRKRRRGPPSCCAVGSENCCSADSSHEDSQMSDATAPSDSELPAPKRLRSAWEVLGGPGAPSSLQRLLSGAAEVPVSRWRQLTTYEPPGAEATLAGARTIEWFWAYAEGLDPAGRASLLEWVSGFRRLPLRGLSVECVEDISSVRPFSVRTHTRLRHVMHDG